MPCASSSPASTVFFLVYARGNIRVDAECHVDLVFGYGMPVFEIPLQQAFDPDLQLKPVAIAEDEILVFRFDSFELAIGEAGERT